MTWQAVQQAVEDAYGYAWDECHKVYVLMDKQQFDLMRGYGYDVLVRASEDGVRDVEMLRDWYDRSCPLRFIQSVRTVDPNEGFADLIPQGDDGGDW